MRKYVRLDSQYGFLFYGGPTGFEWGSKRSRLVGEPGRSRATLPWMLISLLALGLGSLYTPLATAADWYVDQRNPQCDDAGAGTQILPFCTISAAASAVRSGDTVTVSPGIYEEVVDINESGESDAPIRFSAAAEEGDPVVVFGGYYGFDVSGQEGISIQGFTIANTVSHGIRASLSEHITLTSNRIIGAADKGVALSSSEEIVVENNFVDSTSSYGIYVTACSDITLSGNYVTRAGLPVKDMTRKAIYISASCNVRAEYNILDSNTDAGIYLVNGATANYIMKNISFNNARVYTRAAPGYEVRGSANNTLEANIAYGNEDSGINVTGYGGVDANNLIVNNVCYLNGDHGIDVRDQPGVGIIGNTIYRNVTSGINVEGVLGSVNTTIMNNISVDNAIDSPRKDGNINVDENSGPGTVADFNLVYLTDPNEPKTEYEMYVWDGEDYLSLEELRDETNGVEEQGLEADPLWKDLSAFDFQLAAGSPAIDSANAEVDGALPVDFDGNPRYDDPYTPNLGIGPRDYDDRGAYELQVGEPPPPPPPPPVTLSFRPAADTWVNQQEPGENYGNDSELMIDSRPEQITYLQFDISGVEGEVQSARLRLEVTNPTWSGGMIFVSETGWDEAAMTYASGQPAIIGDVLDTFGRISVGQLVEADVTAAIDGDGAYGFAIIPTNPDKAGYCSREGSLETPLLIIEQVLP